MYAFMYDYMAVCLPSSCAANSGYGHDSICSTQCHLPDAYRMRCCESEKPSLEKVTRGFPQTCMRIGELQAVLTVCIGADSSMLKQSFVSDQFSEACAEREL